MIRLGVALTVVLVMLRPAAAETQADKLFEEGRKLLGENKPAEACDKFKEAIALDQNAAGTMLNLGLCHQQLKKYKTALYWFRKAQFRATETNLPVHEKAAREHTTELAGKVATVRIEFIGGAPAGAKVKIDEDEVKPDDYTRAEVDPGPHVLEARAPGKKNVRITFDIPEDSNATQTQTIQFVDGENTIVVDRGAGRRRTALFLGVGGGVLWGVSGGVALYARSQYNMYKDKTTDPAAVEKGNNAVRLAKYWGTGLFIAGSVAIAAGALIYFTAPDKERIDQTVFVPTVGPDSIGFSASGTF